MYYSKKRLNIDNLDPGDWLLKPFPGFCSININELIIKIWILRASLIYYELKYIIID